MIPLARRGGHWPLDGPDAAGSAFCNEVDKAAMVYGKRLDADYAPSRRAGVPIPTHADVGLLAQLIARLDLDLVSINRNLDNLRALLNVVFFDINDAE